MLVMPISQHCHPVLWLDFFGLQLPIFLFRSLEQLFLSLFQIQHFI